MSTTCAGHSSHQSLGVELILAGGTLDRPRTHIALPRSRLGVEGSQRCPLIHTWPSRRASISPADSEYTRSFMVHEIELGNAARMRQSANRW